MSTTPVVEPSMNLNDFLRAFWQQQIAQAEQASTSVGPDTESAFKHPALPLARIKKIMKSDPEVKMVAADGPALLCKACEIFVAEVTARAFLVADSNKRRTISKSDVARALRQSEHFDFLIDIVHHDDLVAESARNGHASTSNLQTDMHMNGDPLSIPTSPSTLPISAYELNVEEELGLLSAPSTTGDQY